MSTASGPAQRTPDAGPGDALQGLGLHLRPWRQSDADEVFTQLQDRAGHRFLELPWPYTRADAAAFVCGRHGNGHPDGREFAVCDAQGRLLGAASLRLPAGPGATADLGSLVYAPARGHGVAERAARLLTDLALAQGAARVQIRCDVRNLASAATALNAGFTFEAVLAGALRGADGALFRRLPGESGDRVRRALPALPDGGLRDGTLLLRPVVEDDLDALVDEHDNAESMRWNVTGTPADRAAMGRRARSAGLRWLVGPSADLAVVRPASGQVARAISLRLTGPPGVVSIGYGVRPAFRGQAVTARALRLLAPWLLDVAGFTRLELGAKSGNIASQRAAAAAGFVPDGVRARRLRNQDGSYSDEAGFVLLKGCHGPGQIGRRPGGISRRV